MADKNIEEINSKSLIRIVEVLQVEDNLPTEGSNEISRNSFGRRIKVRLYEDSKDLKEDELPWVWPLLPKHLQVIPKVGEMVLVLFQSLDGAQGNRFYIGPIISQDYFLDKCGTKEALSLLQARESTKPLCHPQGKSKNDGSYPDGDVIAIQGRGDSTLWLKEEEARIMCGHKPKWGARSNVDRADPGSLEFNEKGIGDEENRDNPYRNISYIQLKFDKFKEQKNSERKFGSVANIVADRIHLITHEGASHMSLKVTDQKELMDKNAIEKFATDGQRMVYGDDLIKFLQQFRQVFRDHTHHWSNDKQVECTKDSDFWNKNLEELLCKTIRLA